MCVVIVVVVFWGTLPKCVLLSSSCCPFAGWAFHCELKYHMAKISGFLRLICVMEHGTLLVGNE